MKLNPLYADWHSMPYHAYLAAQKIVRDKYDPAKGLTVLAELDLIILLYGLTEDQLDHIPSEELPGMVEKIKPFLSAPPILEDLTEYAHFGTLYKIDREPRDISLRQLKAIEEYQQKYADEFDVAMVHVALLVAPETKSAYGQAGPPEPFSMDRARHWKVVREWPTPVCYTLHAFFLRHWLRSKVLTPLSMALQQVENQQVTAA